MHVRINEAAGTEHIVPKELPFINGIDVREKTAERLRLHQVSKMIIAGGKFCISSSVNGKRALVCGYIRKVGK